MWIVGLIFLGVVLAIGVWLLVTGLRGRIVNDHPVCRKCGFDLVGVYPRGLRCPECGGELDEGKVRIGQRVRRRARIAGGVLGVAATLLVGASMIASMTSAVNWNAYMPTGVLVWRLRTSTPTGEHGAIVEISKRFNDDELSSSQIRKIVEAGLSVQADQTRPWDTALGDLIEVMDLKGYLEPDQRSLYWHQAIESSASVQEKIRRGWPVFVELHNTAMRCGNDTRITIEPFVDSIMCEGQLVYKGDPNLKTSWGTSQGVGGGLTSGFREQIPLEPGDNHLRIAWRVRIYEGRFTYPSVENLISEWTDTEDLIVRVVPEIEPMVDWVQDPDIVQRVRESVKIDRVQGRTDYGDSPMLEVYIMTQDRPLPMAFDVILLAGDKEHKLYSLTIPSGSGWHGWGGIGALDEKPVRGEIILRPSEDALGTLNVDEVFGEELRFPVTISWPESGNGPETQDADDANSPSGG
jgi:hypothetical protein